jgi:hypothetical protein
MSVEENKAVIRRAAEAVSSGDLEAAPIGQGQRAGRPSQR